MIYQIATVAQLAFYGCALLGLLLANTRLGRLKPFTIPYFFCMVNAALYDRDVQPDSWPPD